MDSLRLSDAEREEAVARLGEHYAAGRLDKDEYDERSDAVWSARTRGELRPVFADLEAPPSEAAAPYRSPYASRGPAAARGRRTPFGGRPQGWRRLPAPLLVVLGVLVVLTVLTHLPLVVFGLLVWWLLCFRHPRHHRRW